MADVEALEIAKDAPDPERNAIARDELRRLQTALDRLPPRCREAIVLRHVASFYRHAADLNRSRSVVVPNVGAFAGASFRYSNAKVSFGYRADFFFGAMDGGIDTRKSYDRNFPYATISIGLP